MALVTAVFALGAGAAPAAGRSGFHVPLPGGGPALAGGAPVWAEQRPDQAVNIRRRDAATGQILTIASGPANGQDQFARIAGSASTLAAEVISGGVEPDCFSQWCFKDLSAGPAAGPLTPLAAHCALNQAVELPEALDVDGPRIVSFDCSKGVVDITDRSTGKTTQVPGSFRGLRIAGRYVASVGGSAQVDDNTITVYDWKAHTPVYTLPALQTGGYVWDLDLAPNGTVVWPILSGHSGNRLAWASPSSPRAHLIPVAHRDNYQVRFVGGRIAFERGMVATTIPRAEVGITDLAGHVKILATGADMDAFERQFDFDGNHVAWYAFACTGATMHVQSIDSHVIHESMTRCSLRFKRPPKIKQSRVVDLAVNCYGYADGCKGVNAVLRLMHDPFTVVGRGRNAHHINLTDQGAKLLKTHNQLQLWARITMTDLLGTHERRRGVITLMRP